MEWSTRGKRLLQEFCCSDENCFSANDPKELIHTVQHHKDFDAGNVYYDMHNRLMKSVDNGTIDVLFFWKKVNGSLSDNASLSVQSKNWCKYCAVTAEVPSRRTSSRYIIVLMYFMY